MTSVELTTLISGKTAFITTTSKKKAIQVFHADGKVESGNAKRKDSKGYWKPYETGTWQVKDEKLCISYTKPKKRSGRCDKYY